MRGSSVTLGYAASNRKEMSFDIMADTKGGQAAPLTRAP
jgi:hypothetical protein